jgi:hypothetical protein
MEAEGVIIDPADGTLLARSTATFVGASEEKKAELKARYGFAVAASPDPVGSAGSSGSPA